MQWFLIGLIGAGVGFLGGMFGKGGSAIATPLLAAIGVPPIIAVASPLPATIPGTLVAYRRYRGSGHSDPRVIRWSVAFGLPATIVGALVTHWIGGGFLVRLTDAIVAVLGLRILLAGLLANAGGFLLVPLYLAVLHLPIKKALASSLAVASVLAEPGTLVHAALGHIDWRVAAVFGAASIPLSGLGARTALAMNPARLERIYGAGLLTLGITLLAFD